jgi:response regulator RpfG family c-di-GMP phosphodiesterase
LQTRRKSRPRIGASGTAARRSAGRDAHQTILYVEDNPANLELVEQLVARRRDLRLMSAADGNVGLEYARAYLPELILMDINLLASAASKR